MSNRRWGVRTKDKHNIRSYAFLTPSKLKLTIKTLKSRGAPYTENYWASPIIPLLIEHVFIETHTDLKQIEYVTLELNKGKDLKLC